MPAYVQHREVDVAPMVCPSCVGLLPMHVREIEPDWSMARIAFVYECPDCCAEVRQTITRPERPGCVVGARLR
jgi:hypothetical protein